MGIFFSAAKDKPIRGCKTQSYQPYTYIYLGTVARLQKLMLTETLHPVSFSLAYFEKMNVQKFSL